MLRHRKSIIVERVGVVCKQFGNSHPFIIINLAVFLLLAGILSYFQRYDKYCDENEAHISSFMFISSNAKIC